jgi:hypothetical protein
VPSSNSSPTIIRGRSRCPLSRRRRAAIYSNEIMQGATPFTNLTVLHVPNGAAFELDVQ